MVIKNFIVLEGIDGSGTTTQLARIGEKLASMNKSVFLEAEPTKGETGKLIRRVLKNEIEVPPLSLLHLFLADRAEHLYRKETGIEALCQKGIVVCDRYFYSTIAYQSLSLPFETVRSLCESFPIPQFLFFIDTPVDVADSRIQKRGNEKEIFETIELQKRVRDNYIKTFDSFKNNGSIFTVLEGTRSIEEITESILNTIKSIL